MSGNFFHPHLEVLPRAQRQLWIQLGPVSELGFVLYGGTAIALRLGHRSSLDFDFFSERALDRSALYDRLPQLRASEVLQDRPDTWTLLMGSGDDGTKVSFFCGIDNGRAGEPSIASDNAVQVASTLDLLATKLKVILQRIEAKDYIDIAALVDAGLALGSGLGGARALYGSAFQPLECLKALTYFEGGDLGSLSDRVKTTLLRASRGAAVDQHASVLSRKLSL